MKKTIPLDESSYSMHFRTLRLIGAWVVDPDNRLLLNLYAVYKTAMTIVSAIACGSLFLDFYIVFGDFKKMTWNLCISTLFAGSLLKNIYTIHKSNVINKIRKRLHEEESARESIENEIINAESLKELKYVRIFFYGFASISIPLWLVTRYISYYWGTRDIPIPFRLPFSINYDDGFEYNLSFILVGLAGCAGLLLVIETELCMFSILIQISREYNRLLNDINHINYMYDEYGMSLNFEYNYDKKDQVEVNPLLRKVKTKMLLREFSNRQQHLIEYTNDFEVSYGLSMLLQSFVLSLVLIVSAIQCMLEYGNFSMNLSYQIGYIIILLMDMFLICWYASRIRDQCFRVGHEFYSIVWYTMSIDIQKDIQLLIMRSQCPPKITIGKVMEMNLHAFMILTRNIYSWLTLFKQLEFKFKDKEKL